jgi:hypothetical protein
MNDVGGGSAFPQSRFESTNESLEIIPMYEWEFPLHLDGNTRI